MKKKVTLSLVFVFILAICFIAVYKVNNNDEEENDFIQVSSAEYFNEEYDESRTRWIFTGDSNSNTVTECYVNCEIESGGLILRLYDNNGYSYKESEKFILVREEVITQSGEYYYDFTDLPEGIYSFAAFPQSIGDSVYFEYTYTFKQGD